MRNSALTFGKAQISAFSGGISDYGIMILLTEVLTFHYTVSIIISGSLGALVNFYLNRKWAFRSTTAFRNSLRNQVWKFILVILGSVMLKSSGTFYTTTNFQLDYKISRVLVDLMVSYSFNYPLIKYWVFPKSKYADGLEDPSFI